MVNGVWRASDPSKNKPKTRPLKWAIPCLLVHGPPSAAAYFDGDFGTVKVRDCRWDSLAVGLGGEPESVTLRGEGLRVPVGDMVRVGRNVQEGGVAVRVTEGLSVSVGRLAVGCSVGLTVAVNSVVAVRVPGSVNVALSAEIRTRMVCRQPQPMTGTGVPKPKACVRKGGVQQGSIRTGEGWGMGIWDPKVYVPKTAGPEFSNGKFRFFPL